MNSSNMFKGYGKVNNVNDHHLEDQPPHPKISNHKPFIATISIFAILFLILTIPFLIHHTTTEPPEQTPNSAATATATAASIRAVCNVTRFPDSCFSSITNTNTSTFFPQNPTDPESILNLSLHVSLNELTKLSSLLKSMASNSKAPALADCKDQMDDALSRLNDSLSAMEAALTDAKIIDIQTWVSAAVTDQETCLDGLEEMESETAGEVKNMMQRSREYTSNSLAIVANIHTLLQHFHIPLH